MAFIFSHMKSQYFCYMDYFRLTSAAFACIAVGYAAAQDCANSFNPVQDWTWTYRTQNTDKKGQVQATTWQRQTQSTAAGFDTIVLSGKQQPSKSPYRCTQGAHTSLTVPSVAGAQITKASVTGFSIAAPANWRVGYEWNNVWNVEGRKGLLRGAGDFTLHYRIVDLEKVKVPAGEFEAFKVELTMTLKMKAGGVPLNQALPTSYAWYAKDVGLVKQIWGRGNLTELMSLKK
ncbi:hypothetical protein [Deinococcus cavernae]|nr:hypothetical protein [Deinococcus cavernae]